MGIEIERKFLVSGDGWQSVDPIYFCQGYLNRDKHRTVRVRIAGDEAFLTVKGLTSQASRKEYEYSIPVTDAKELLELCEQPLIEKNRRVVEYSGMLWEIDEFLGENYGLVVAEIELQSEEQEFDLPVWVGTEVTNDARFFNSNLSVHPFRKWTEDSDT